MRFGIMTPIVSRNPRHDPPGWEAGGTVEDVAAVAVAGERLGYEFLTFPEHVAIPDDVAPARGGTYWAPLPTMGYVAAHTTTIRLATYVVVLGYHHPLELAKSYGTLDRISGGRVILGVGVGSLRPEFELLDAPFDGRGERADDALRALRASFSSSHPEYHGTHYDYAGWVLEPHGLDRHLPIWVGGRTRRSLRRAVELGDGWSPFGLPTPTVEGYLSGVDLPPAFDVVLHPEPPVDPIDDADATRTAVERYAAAGATQLVFRFRHRSRSHLVEQLEALVALCPEARA